MKYILILITAFAFIGCGVGRPRSGGPVCRTGCACGNSCISCDYVCRTSGIEFENQDSSIDTDSSVEQ